MNCYLTSLRWRNRLNNPKNPSLGSVDRATCVEAGSARLPLHRQPRGLLPLQLVLDDPLGDVEGSKPPVKPLNETTKTKHLNKFLNLNLFQEKFKF